MTLDALPFDAWPLGAQAGIYGFAGGLLVLLLAHLAVPSRRLAKEARQSALSPRSVPSIFSASNSPGIPFKEIASLDGRYSTLTRMNRPLRKTGARSEEKRRQQSVPRYHPVPSYRT